MTDGAAPDADGSTPDTAGAELAWTDDAGTEEEWPELVVEPAPAVAPRPSPGATLVARLPNGLRTTLRDGTLRIDGLPLAVRRVTMVALAATAVALFFLAPHLLLGWWPAPVIRIPGTFLAEPLPGRLSIPAFVAALAALTAGAAAVAGASSQRPGRSRRLAQVALGIAGVEVGAALYGTGGIADIAVDPTLASVPRVMGGIAMAAGLALALSPLRLSRTPAWTTITAALPFMAAGLATLQLAGEHASVQLGAADNSWPRTVEGAALAAASLSGVLALAGGLLGVLLLWQSVVAARAVRRRVASATSTLAAGRPRVLAALLGAKAAWLVAGYAGLLPALLAGGTASGWDSARADDPAGVAVAAGLAVLAIAWLLRGARPRVTDSGVPAAVAIFAVGFNAPFLVAGLLLGLFPILSLAGAAAGAPPSGIDLQTCLALIGATPAGVDACLSVAARELIPYAGLVTWAASAALAIGLVVARRGQGLAVALAAIVVWATPSAVFVLQGVLGTAPEIVAGRPELITVDTLLTVAVAVLAILWWTGRQRTTSPRSLTLILVVSTLLAHAGALVPDAARPLVFGLLIVLPPLYGLLFESERINGAGEARRELVPRTLGLQLLGLGLLLTAIAFDTLLAGAADLADLLVPPVVAVLVAAEIARRERPRALPTHPRPVLATVMRWAGAGAATVAVVAVVLGAVRLPAPGPSDAARYGAFVTRVDVERGLGAQALDNLLTIVSTDPNGIEGAFIEFSTLTDAAAGWIADNPPASCYAAEAEGWAGVVAAMVAARDSLLSGVAQEASLGAYVQAARDFSPGLAACPTTGRAGG